VRQASKWMAHPLWFSFTKDAVFRLCSREIQKADAKIGLLSQVTHAMQPAIASGADFSLCASTETS